MIDGGTLPLTTADISQDFRDFLATEPAVELMRAASSPDNAQAKAAAHKFADAFIKYMEAQNGTC